LSKLVSGLCCQRVLIASTLDDTRFKSARAMTDLAGNMGRIADLDSLVPNLLRPKTNQSKQATALQTF